MANIAVITNNPTGNSAVRIAAALTAVGHTVTQINSSVAGSTDFSGYDLVIVGIITNSEMAATASILQELNKSGKPLILSGVVSGISSGGRGYIHTATLMGLGSYETVGNSNNAGQVVPNTAGVASSIFSGYVSGTAYHTLSASSNDYCAALIESIGTTLATGGSDAFLSGQPVVVTMESGLEARTGWKLGNRIVYLSFLYVSGTSNFSANGTIFLQRAVSWALAGVVTVQAEAAQILKVSAYVAISDRPDAIIIDKLSAYTVLMTPANDISVAIMRAYVVIGDPPSDRRAKRIQNIHYIYPM